MASTSATELPVFLSVWENLFLFVQCGMVAKCLLCDKELQCIKKCNLQRHYSLCHAKEYDKYEGEERDALLHELKERADLEDYKNSESCVRLSYRIALHIARKVRPFTEGDFAKEVIVMAAEEICPQLVHEFERVSLSPKTIMRRIQDMGADVHEELSHMARKFVCYSLAVDESGDISDTEQLAIFIRGVDDQLNIKEELLDLVPLKGTTTGLDIFTGVEEALAKCGLSWNKLVSVATDGAPSMLGVNVGLITRMKQHMKLVPGATDELIAIHCILHQENLCAKYVDMKNIMDTVIKVTNSIRSRGLRHRQFKSFLEECDSKYGDLPYHCNVRWLSRGKVLDRFFELRKEISLFMTSQNQPVPQLEEQTWICDLAFLADLTGHLNNLNTSLQGKGLVITDMYYRVKAFRMSLDLWANQLLAGNTVHFPKLSQVRDPDNPFEKYVQILKNLICQFESRFQDVETFSNMFELFATPYSVDVNNVPSRYQMELLNLQCDDLLKDKYRHKKDIADFYRNFSQNRFPRLYLLAARVLCMFGSTYACEQLFLL